MFECIFKSNSAIILVVGGREESTKAEYYDKSLKRWQKVADFDEINEDLDWKWESNRWKRNETKTLTKSWKRTSIGHAPLVYIHDKFYTFGGEETLSTNTRGLGPKNTTTLIGCLDLSYNSNGTVGKWSIVGLSCNYFVRK